MISIFEEAISGGEISGAGGRRAREWLGFTRGFLDTKELIFS
jgi:hypothetical protein